MKISREKFDRRFFLPFQARFLLPSNSTLSRFLQATLSAQTSILSLTSSDRHWINRIIAKFLVSLLRKHFQFHQSDQICRSYDAVVRARATPFREPLTPTTTHPPQIHENHTILRETTQKIWEDFRRNSPARRVVTVFCTYFLSLILCGSELPCFAFI